MQISFYYSTCLLFAIESFDTPDNLLFIFYYYNTISLALYYIYPMHWLKVFSLLKLLLFTFYIDEF